MPAPKTTLNPLRRPDGSATHSQNGYTIIGAVNGPIEVQRRDEIPDEAAIEVNVRPATGVGCQSSLSPLHFTLPTVFPSPRRAQQTRQPTTVSYSTN